MTAALPQGLINANPIIQQYAFDDSSVNFTNAEALHKFWKVYAIQSDATQEDSATRSRNLFWRVWSSRTLTQSITSARLMRLWQQCSQEFDLTPIGGNINLPQGSVLQDVPTSRQSRNRSSSLSPSESRPTTDSSPQGGQDVGPSLQKFTFSSVSQQLRGEPPRLPLRSAGDSSRQRSEDTSGSTSQTTSDSSSRPTLSRTGSGGRQRLSVLANAGKARTRPQLPRRKSSAQKSTGAPSQPKSPRAQTESSAAKSALQDAGAIVDRLAVRGPPPGLPVPPSATSGSAFALPSASSWQSVESTSPNLPLATTAPVLRTTSKELVDPDFRGKFVQTQKKMASSTNLAGLGRMRRPGSIVRFADELPQEELGKGKEREAVSPLRDENVGLSRLRTSMASEAISDTSDSDSSSSNMELPRSKSQLSLLIQHKRSETGSSDIGPPAQLKESKGKEKEARQKAKSKEEELLSMGRRDGVTKAGGVQVPKQHRVSELDDPGYLSASSPEPLF